MPADWRGRRGAQQKVNWWRVVFAAAAVSIQVTVRPSVCPSVPRPSNHSSPLHSIHSHSSSSHRIWLQFGFSSRGAAKRVSFCLQFRFVFQFFDIFGIFFFWFFWLFGFPFSCRACCSAIKCTNCNWPNANRKLYMEINYDTNATNERDKIEFPLSVCVLSCCAV